jgi:adenylate kinase
LAEFYIICGQTGVGKTTVAQRLAEGRDNVTIVNFGETIFELAKEAGLIETRDQLNRLWPDTVSWLQTKATKSVAEKLSGKVILDMHVTVHTPAGYIAGMPRRMMEQLNPKRLVLLEADPYEVVRRRMVGKEMKDVEESLKDIQEHADFDRAAAMSISVDVGTPIMIVKNEDLEKTIIQLSNLLDEEGALGPP